ncbi:MAG TPA: Type 1 glutamine amidotransferase-like domain-containing protein [Patescibacteria group bacterium]
MKQLILSGGGDSKDSKELFVSLLPKDPEILYIPIAINADKHPYPECLAWIKSELAPFGVNKITMWTDLNNKKLDDLKKFSAIYIGGGNTYKLLNEFRKTGFYELLKNYIEKGGVIYGGSAGAIIFSKSIDPAGVFGDVNEVGLKDTSGFDLLNGFQLWCHYTPDDDEKIKKYIDNKNIKIIALSEESAIYVNDSEIKTVGPDNVVVFNKLEKSVYSPDTTLNKNETSNSKS